MSKKSHLMKVWEQTGRMPDELRKVIPAPKEFMYLWNWLWELATPLSYAELRYWQELTGRSLSRWEVSALQELDRVRNRHD